MALSSAHLINTSTTISFESSPLNHHRSRCGFSNRRIFATAVTLPSYTGSTNPPEPPRNLPIKKIPGDYGLPIIGPLSDRQDYFYNQGRDDFFKSRIQKYKSTVFRVNMPPGPFISYQPNVVVLLDGKSFPTLFDTSKVDKTDVFTGTYRPSVELTGGYRVLSYLDPSEPSHAKLKQLVFKLLTSTRHRVLPEFQSSFGEMFDELENELATNGKAKFNEASDKSSFNFLARAWFGADPVESELGLTGPGIISKWVLFQLGPLLKLGLPKCIEELSLHSVRLPFNLIKKDYTKL